MGPLGELVGEDVVAVVGRAASAIVVSVIWMTKCATYINHRQGTPMTSIDTITRHLQLLVPPPKWHQEQAFFHAIKLQRLCLHLKTSSMRKMKTSTSPSWIA